MLFFPLQFAQMKSLEITRMEKRTPRWSGVALYRGYLPISMKSALSPLNPRTRTMRWNTTDFSGHNRRKIKNRANWQTSIWIHMKSVMWTGRLKVDFLKGNPTLLSTSAILYHKVSNLEQKRVAIFNCFLVPIRNLCKVQNLRDTTAASRVSIWPETGKLLLYS